MLSLGVNIGHDRGAALVKDGEILCAVSLERLDRNKHSVGVALPYQAMEYCLGVGNYEYADLDVIVYNYPHHNKAYPVLDKVKAELSRLCDRVVFVPHHLAHAYSVFYASPFDESVVLVCDGAGNKYSGDTKEFYKNWHWGISANEQEIEAESAYYFTNEDKRLIYKRWQTRTGDNQKLSLGRMYWEACKHVGMGIFDGGKLMGLAPYGERLTEPLNIVKQNGGDFSIDLTSIKSLPSGSFEENAKTAWIIQNSLEETLVWLANMLHRKNPFPNICISGGVGLNSVSNERILRESPFENIFVAPASNDSGVALGCAYFGYYQVLGGRNRKTYKTYTGREYGRNEIVESLEKNDGQIECRESSNLSADVAKLIADEKIVAWFQGGSEYGPRALGNRSILCDPGRAEMKDILNDKVKHREAYRPFAPSVLYEEAAKYFDVCGECPYMLQIVDVLEHKRDDLAAITHVDGTARIQTLRREQNPKYYDLIKAFGDITGIPVVLNTSFNIAGEPIVETPDDALRCFLNTNIDVLVMGDFIVQKTKVKEAVGTSYCTGRSTRKRILLATSAASTQSPFSTKEKRPPVGIGFLISVLRNAGHEVFFVDNYLQPNNFLETDYLQEHQIDYVGIYANTICFRDTLRMIYKLEDLRQTHRWDGKIILGGPHTTVAVDTIPDFVDYVVQGEGERAILAIVSGIVGQRVVSYPRIENLDMLPMPAWDYFVDLPYDWSVKFFEDKPVFTMNTSRGCPFNCAFCSVGSVWGKKYTYFSAERIVSDVEYLIKRYGLKGVYFREDNFTLNKERLRRFCNLLIEKGIKISWVCESRVSNLSRDLVESMSRAGAKGFYFGVESGSQRILDLLHKDITVEQIKNAFEWCHEFNVKTAASLIVGVPGETESDRRKTDELLKAIGPDVVWTNIFVGIPESDLYHFTLNKRLYEYIDDRGLVYLQGHNSRVKRYYGDNLNFYIPNDERNKDMTLKPKVSVLICVCNGEKFIGQALESIYNQTYQDFEVVIVDDGSTDRTADILLDMKDSRTFIYRNSENKGLTKSLNIGLKLCRGEYVARMDADDISYPQRFEKQVRFLDENPNGIALGCWCNRIDSNGQIHGAYDGQPIKPEDIKRQLLIGNCIAHPTAMVRRASLVEAGGYNERYAYAQDHDLWLRLSEVGRIYNLDEYLVGLRFWPENITATKGKQQLEYSGLAVQEALQRRKGAELTTVGKYLEQESDWKPRFSIVMANYNNTEYIAEAIESVLRQTFEDWELIIIDDCSTDNSSEIINQYLSDKRVRLIQHERNRGYIAALKTGIANVQSEYFGILDGDDCLTKLAVETIYLHHVKHPDCGLIYSQFMYCHEDLTPRQIGYCNKIPADKTNLEVNVVSGFKTFKMRDYLRTLGYDEDILYAEDKDVIYKMEEVTRLKFVDQCLYLARELPNSQSRDSNKAFIGRQSHEKARINALRRRGQLRSEERDSGTATINLRAHYTLGSSYLKDGKYSEAQIALEPILASLMKTLKCSASQLSGQELERYNMMAECYLSVCTKLAQCYVKQEKYDKVEQIYSDLLNNQYLTLPEGQKAAIHAVLAKIRNIKLPAFSTEHSRQNPSSKNVRESEPLVSVYIVTYNMERFIRQAIDSALAQTYRNLELLVVDDGSTDRTKQIVESYSDDRIRYIYKPHKNFASGMNMAISEAKGEYLIGVDSDDFIATDYIEKLLNCARRHPEIDYFYPAKLVLVDESGNPTGREWDHLDFSDNSALPAFLFGNGYSPIPNSPSLKRKSLFDKVGLYEELDTVEDFVFLSKNALTISFKKVEEHSTYFYRRLPESNCYKFKARNQITARALNDMVSMYPAEVLYPQIAGINDPALRDRQYYKYLMETFYKHVNGHMVRYGEYFQQYGDYYKEKLLNLIAKTDKAVSSVDGASAQDDLLRLFKQGVENLKEARPQDALVYFDKACRLDGKVRNLQYARAVALMQLGRCNDARLACEAELAVQPDHGETQVLLNKISQDVSIIN